ncbi:hypothetical protein AU14_13185 [Marinobacter similis]|uniref:Uncharacterized protein n=1 Tax=Marinobacter similis TaxID=1420916 RepID=W5YM27_9GAMM|nr:hypothetical protein AU14_13185 [Marinobacter similis]
MAPHSFGMPSRTSTSDSLRYISKTPAGELIGLFSDISGAERCLWAALAKMLEAKDGRKQVHMDVLVAVFGRAAHKRHTALLSG